MKNYLTALEYCFENGDFVKSRAGNVKKAFGYQMLFGLKIQMLMIGKINLNLKEMLEEYMECNGETLMELIK